MTQSISPTPAGARYLPVEHFLPTKQAANMLAQPSWKFIVALVALKHGLLQRELLGPSREHRLVGPRYEAMHLIYRHTHASMPMIGRWFGRHHTTVLFGLSRIGSYAKLVDELPPPPPEPPKPRPALNKREPRTALQKAVRRAYEHQVRPSVVAEEYACSVDSVRVLAHRLGMRRSDYRPKSKYAPEAVEA